MTTIRTGRLEDLPAVLELVHELAAFEKAPHEVVNTVSMMKADGFGEKPVFGFFVAEVDGKIVGTSIFYWRYSTWKGRRLWLEDIIVHEPFRSTGLGTQLFNRTVLFAAENNSQGMMWQVLDWNEPAIRFYRQYGTRFDHEWINCTLERNQIEELAEKLKGA